MEVLIRQEMIHAAKDVEPKGGMEGRLVTNAKELFFEIFVEENVFLVMKLSNNFFIICMVYVMVKQGPRRIRTRKYVLLMTTAQLVQFKCAL